MVIGTIDTGTGKVIVEGNLTVTGDIRVEVGAGGGSGGLQVGGCANVEGAGVVVTLQTKPSSDGAVVAVVEAGCIVGNVSGVRVVKAYGGRDCEKVEATIQETSTAILLTLTPTDDCGGSSGLSTPAIIGIVVAGVAAAVVAAVAVVALKLRQRRRRRKVTADRYAIDM